MLLFANNADSTLKVGALATDTTLHLQDGTGGRFPLAGAGDTFFLTLVAALGDTEIVEVTERVGDVLTVIRARDGTTAKSFAAGSVVDHRVVAEVFRRMSAETLVGEANGIAPLDVEARVPVEFLPDDLTYSAEADALYLRKTAGNEPGGYPLLDGAGKIGSAQLPGNVLTLAVADAAYVPLTQRGAASGVATLGADGKVPAAQLPDPAAPTVDLTPYAPLDDPVFPDTIAVGGKATLAELAVTGNAALANVTANEVSTLGAVTIMGGAARGKLTLSTAPPSGVPATGDEWIQYTP